MNRILVYIIIGIIVLLGLYYFLGETGLLSGLVAIVGVGGTSMKVGQLKEENDELERRKEEKTKQLREIEEKQKELKMKDLTPEEEKDYWKTN